MDDRQRKTLLKIARDTIDAVINQIEPPKPQSDDPELNESCGCFVTLKNQGRLRGCIGQFTAQETLIEVVSAMAKAAAVQDPRFMASPIGPDELESLEVEISVLSPLERTENPLDLKLGEHGIYIKRGGASGCFLPQVAEEAGWGKEEFLSYCCSHKAGLTPDAWKDPATEVYLFTAEIFGAHFRDI